MQEVPLADDSTVHLESLHVIFFPVDTLCQDIMHNLLLLSVLV